MWSFSSWNGTKYISPLKILFQVICNIPHPISVYIHIKANIFCQQGQVLKGFTPEIDKVSDISSKFQIANKVFPASPKNLFIMKKKITKSVAL